MLKAMIDPKLLQATIDDLRDNPNAVELAAGMNIIHEDGSTEPVYCESSPSQQFSDFVGYLYEHDLIDTNYIENEKKLGDKDIAEYTQAEAITKLTYIIRGDRFCSGLIYESFKDGELLKLLEQIQKTN